VNITKTLNALRCGAAPLIVGIAMVSVNAYAQTVPAEADAAEATPDDAIVVTGSRIQRPDLAASSPVAVLTAEAIKGVNTVTVEQILATNPQFMAGFGGSSNNPGDGSATVDLRGLGTNRTLVLIDGKRAPFYDTSGAVDVNSIPTALIKRIDILTGGASAVYGSDAVAGVVNFVLDDRFEGLSADGSTQISSRADAALYNISLTGGMKLGERGNIVVSGGYSKRKGLYYAARPRNATALDSSDLVSSGGSSNGVPTLFDIPGNEDGTIGGLQQVQSDGSLSPDLNLYNFSPVNYAQLPFERYNAMALGRYELSDNVELYGRASYSHVKVDTNLAPTATAGFGFNLDSSNPFLSAQERDAFFNTAANPFLQINDDGTSTIGIRRRMIETGGRQSTYTTNNYQFVGGLRGDLGSTLHYDVFAQYGQSKRHTILRNDLSYTALQQALDVVAGPGGVAQCRDTSGGCVPLNLFNTGTIPADQLAFVLRNANEDTKTTQFIGGGNLSGDLGFLKSPFADGSAAFSVGAEYRREKGTTAVDPLYASGDLIYYGQGQNISGKYDVKELYAEVKMPLVQDKPGFNSLNIEGGFRFSDYSTVGSVYTYKGGGDYSPIDGVRFRGIYQRAVRAPNLYELFSPVVAGTGSLQTDPCAGGGVPADIAAICIAQGAPTVGGIAQPISGQVNIFTGGNTALKEEKADTITLGMVINPPSMKNLSFSVDYYKIKIRDAIDNTPVFVTINQCYNIDKNAASAACSGIHRNPISGSLSGDTTIGVPAQYGNVAAIKTEGLDIAANYHGGNQDAFNYSVNFAGTYVFSYKKQSDPTSPVYQCAGTFGGACDLEPMPKWKHVFEVNLGYKSFNLLSRWRFLGKVKEDAATDILKSNIGSFSYFDETASVNVSEALTFRLGVLNLFDKKSPIVGDTVGAGAVAGSTFPNTYDVIGRQFFAGASLKF
jgi:outer membrane receptor protein involved in Fe transport